MLSCAIAEAPAIASKPAKTPTFAIRIIYSSLLQFFQFEVELPERPTLLHLCEFPARSEVTNPSDNLGTFFHLCPYPYPDAGIPPMASPDASFSRRSFHEHPFASNHPPGLDRARLTGPNGRACSCATRRARRCFSSPGSDRNLLILKHFRALASRPRQ